jgi:hypothetical protein
MTGFFLTIEMSSAGTSLMRANFSESKTYTFMTFDMKGFPASSRWG